LLNVKANPLMTAPVFWGGMMWSALTAGNAYAQIVRNRIGNPVELWPIPFHRIKLEYKVPGDIRTMYWQYSGDSYNPSAELEIRDVFHIRGNSLSHAMTGDPQLMAAFDALTLAVCAEKFATKYFGNNAHVGSIVEMPESRVRAELKKDANAIREQVAENKRGIDNVGKPIVLPPGFKFTPLSLKAKDADLDVMIGRGIESIARFFHVPLTMLDVHASAQGYGNNHQALRTGYIQDGVIPWTTRIEAEGTDKLFPVRGMWNGIFVDLSEHRLGTAQERAETIKTYGESGTRTVNELRAIDNMPAIDGQDELPAYTANPERDEKIHEGRVTKGIETRNEARLALGLGRLEQEGMDEAQIDNRPEPEQEPEPAPNDQRENEPASEPAEELPTPEQPGGMADENEDQELESLRSKLRDTDSVVDALMMDLEAEREAHKRTAADRDRVYQRSREWVARTQEAAQEADAWRDQVVSERDAAKADAKRLAGEALSANQEAADLLVRLKRQADEIQKLQQKKGRRRK
jgi:HK97 family phage portal protein